MIEIFEKHQLIIGEVIVGQIGFILYQIGIYTSTAIDRFNKKWQGIVIFVIFFCKIDAFLFKKKSCICLLSLHLPTNSRRTDDRCYPIFGKKIFVFCHGK